MSAAVDAAPTRTARPPQEWELRPLVRARTIAIALAIAVLLAISGKRMEIDRLLRDTGEYALAGVGLKESSSIGRSTERFVDGLLPFQIGSRTETALIQDFDRERLPWFSRIEQQRTVQPVLDPETLTMSERVEIQEVLVEPIGYLGHVLVLMVKTIEIALWATLLALLVSLPVAFLGASNLTPHRSFYSVARGISSFLRAMPELILAMVFVLAFGFGPIAGILALGLHSAGFFGKFFADDIENADRGPQEALTAAGAGRLTMLRFAIIPQVWPQFVAYLQYILERNIRTATVIGVVGAGGIGLELKGRFEMFNYHHVSTILLVIFLTVVLLEAVVGRLRAKLI